MDVDYKCTERASLCDLGIESLDADHQYLLRLIAGLRAATRLEAAKDEVYHQLVSIKMFVELHFHREEALMRKFAFPLMAQHLGEHANLLKTLNSEIHKFHANRASADHITGFVENWVASHLGHDDRELADHLKAEGPTAT